MDQGTKEGNAMLKVAKMEVDLKENDTTWCVRQSNKKGGNGKNNGPLGTNRKKRNLKRGEEIGPN